MEDLNKIVERVQKLLRMAADTSSPNEATIAAGRARKLMDQHQLTMADLKDKSGFSFANVDKDYRFMPLWKNVMSVAVAKFNDCRCTTINVWKKTNQSYSRQIVFQGYESDVAVAKAMFEYLVVTIDRLCSNYVKPLGYTRYPAKIGDAFKKAAAMEIVARLEIMQRERQEELKTKTGTSLVLFKMAAVEAEFGEAKYKSTKVASRQDQRAYEAAREGRKAGASIGLNAQIGEARDPVIITGALE